MDLQQAINTLRGNGWSQRRIARELGINRETVAKYRRDAREVATAKPAIPPTGSSERIEAKPVIVPTGSPAAEAPLRDAPCEPKPATVSAGLEAGRKSQCEPF